MPLDQPNPVTAILFNLRPEGIQIEARPWKDRPVTDYRFTRLSDGLWCQESVSDTMAYTAIYPRGIAEAILNSALQKLDRDKE